MLIILLTVVVLALAAVAGFFQGAIRSLVSLVGVFLGALLALPLGEHLKPLVPKVGLENPVWAWFVPAVVVFLLFLAVFIAIAFVAHRQVALYFKYKTDEYQRLSWERMNQRLGVCIGVFTGSIYVVLLCLAIYIAGYLSTQVTAGENDPALLRFVNQARKDLQATGMDKLVARFDPAKDEFYQASDIIGLLHRNPLLESRLADYPFFLSLTDRQEFKDLAEDKEFQTLRERQPSLGELISHPKVMAITGSDELLGILRQVDLKDLQAFLRTGKSAKYDEEKILGRWRLDPAPTMRELRRLSPEMSSAEFSQAKKIIYMVAPLVSLVSSPDNKFVLKVNVAELASQVMTLAAAGTPTTAAPSGQVVLQAVPQPVETAPRVDAQMAQRYGLRPGGQAAAQGQQPAPVIIQAPPPRPAAAPAPGAFPPMGLLAESLRSAAEQQPTASMSGTWERDVLVYKLKLQDPTGKEREVEGSADEERMKLTVPIMPAKNLTLVFYRA